MTTIPKLTAFVASFGLFAGLAAADTGATALCPDVVSVTVDGKDVQVPPELAVRIEELQRYGTRYARLVTLILEENARPGWTFREDCPISDRALLASGN